MAKALHILLIEDDPTTIFAMTAGLNDTGHIVSSATSVAEGLAALSKPHTYDVILLDLRLGPDRGETIFIELRQRGIPSAPVVILSAQTENEIQQAAKTVEAAEALRKPVPISKICDVIERVAA